MRKIVFLVVSLLVSIPVLAVPKAWTGAVSGNWSNPQNWSPQAVPATGEALAFPAGVPNMSMTNDLVGANVGPMTFNNGYTLSGNALMLSGDVSEDFSLTLNVDVKVMT